MCPNLVAGMPGSADGLISGTLLCLLIVIILAREGGGVDIYLTTVVYCTGPCTVETFLKTFDMI